MGCDKEGNYHTLGHNTWSGRRYVGGRKIERRTKTYLAAATVRASDEETTVRKGDC